MGLLSDFRDARLLRRLVIALESLAESQRTLAEFATADHESPVREPQPMTVSTFDQKAANAEYKRNVMREYGFATDEEYEEWLNGRRSG